MLIALISLFLASLFGLGLVFFTRDVKAGTLQGWQAYVAGITGLMLGELPIYLGASQRASLPFVMVIGTGMGIWALTRHKLFPIRTWRILAVLPLAGYVAWRIIADYLHAHDAYSIWFFHARILFHDQGFVYPHWQNPEILFSHPDYPKVASILGSQIATLMGFWNDYLPKFNLAFFLLLAELGLYLLPFPTWGLFLVNAAFLRAIWEPLWWGYMDGWVGLFGFLTAMQLGLFIKGRGKGYLSAGLASAALLSQIKNEGAVLAFLLIASAFVTLAIRRRAREAIGALHWRQAIPFVPLVLWTVLKKANHLTNYFARNFSWGKVNENFHYEPFWSGFFEFFFLKYPMVLFIPAFALFFFYRRKKWDWDASLFILESFIAYSGFVFFAFLSSPMDFPGHYVAAMSRLCMAPAHLLLACVVLQLTGSKERIGAA